MAKNNSCIYHPSVDAIAEIMIEGGGVVNVCGPCHQHIMNPSEPRYYCKHCAVLMNSKEDHTAIEGQSHKDWCPRKELVDA